jgi:hypothetical protein
MLMSIRSKGQLVKILVLQQNPSTRKSLHRKKPLAKSLIRKIPPQENTSQQNPSRQNASQQNTYDLKKAYVQI